MSHPAYRRYGLAAAGLLLVLAGTARAADDDFEFADSLSRRGYTDLATEVFNSLISDPKSTAQKKAEGQYGLALLTYSDARFLAGERNDKRRKPMGDVLKRFDEADQAFAKFIEGNPSHPRNLEAKLSRGKLLQDKAEYVNTCLAENWTLPSGTTPASWQKQVADWFDTAIQLFESAEKKAKDELDALRANHKDSGDDWEEAHDRYGLIWLYRLAALYGKGAALPKGDAIGVASLTQCVKEGSDDYQWEFGESVRGLWAIHYAGLSSAVLDKPADAFNFLKTAAGFTAEKDSSPSIQDITFQSYRELGKMCIAFGRRDKDDWPKRALDLFEGDQKALPGLAKAWPEWKKHPEGQRAGLVWASLLERAGQAPKALALVQDIVKAAEKDNSPTRFEATRELGRLLAKGQGGGGGGAALDPATLRKIALSKWREQDLGGAVHAFQAVLANCEDKDDWDNFGWEAWDYIGRCYGATQRYYEAFLAFDQIEQAWRKDKANPKLAALTDDTGYSRAAALDSLVRQTKDAADKAAAAQALEDFSRDHPNAPKNLDTGGQIAAAKLKDAEAVRDDPAAYRAALAEALKLYEALPATSDTVDLNRAIVAQIHQKMGAASPVDAAELDKAIAAADAWLAEKRPDATKATVRSARERGRGVAVSVAISARADKAAAAARTTAAAKGTDADASAKAAASVKAHQDLLAALDRYGADFVKVAAANGQAQLDNWRAEGLIGTGKVDDADQLVGKLLQENPAARNNIYLAALIGGALDRASLERKGVGDENGYKQLQIRSGRRREWVLDNAKLKDGSAAPRNPDSIRSIALCYANGGDFAKAEALYLEAQKAYDDAAAAADKPDDKDRFLKKSRTCRIDLIDLLVKQGKFDAAIPQLEKELAKDPKVRDAFLKKVQTTDNIAAAEFKTMLDKTDANKGLLDSLSEAYMKAPSKERLFAAVNFCAILTLTMPPEEKHGPEYIDFTLRGAEAYLMLGEYSRLPEHYRHALGAIRNGIVIPGYVDGYELSVPGSKKRGETIMQKAEEGLRKLGAK